MKLRAHLHNSTQESGSHTSAISRILACVEIKSILRALRCVRLKSASLALSGLIALSARTVVFPQTEPAPPPRTSIVVFADRSMPDAQWPALFAALRAALANPSPGLQSLDPSAEFLRGDLIHPGIQVDNAIAVYFHGDCTLTPAPRRTAFAVPLGWVRRVNGRIEPFIHVDCTHIAQMLGPQALGQDRESSSRIMAGAIARVILHEWIHIATQNSTHAEQGISRPEFSVPDLMAGGSRVVALGGR
jgi:hypothetical protein